MRGRLRRIGRKAPVTLEFMAKRHHWQKIALVGTSDADALSRLVATLLHLHVTVVAVWTEPVGELTARAQALGRKNRLLRMAKAYENRVTLVEAPDLDNVPEIGEDFDALALFNVHPKRLSTIGGAWMQLVRPGGWLLGKDHRDPTARQVLNEVAPGWQQHDDGLWSLQVAPETPPKSGRNRVTEGDDFEPAQEDEGLEIETGGVISSPKPSRNRAAQEDRPAPKRRGRPPGSKTRRK